MPKTNLCKPREDPREAAVRAMIAGEAARCCKKSRYCGEYAQ